jgi:hypothetical protein
MCGSLSEPLTVSASARVDARDSVSSPFTKNLRDPSGISQPETVVVPWSDEGKGVIDAVGLAGLMKALPCIPTPDVLVGA